MHNLYFDIAATTPLDNDVVKLMNEIQSNIFGNPSSIHKFGQESKAIVERARLNMANLLGCDLSEIIFTGCGSESNNIALLGLLKRGDHFITSSYEHPAVLKTANELEKNGIDVTYIKPSPSGLIELKDIENSINIKTKLVSIMYVNNELGTENPINQIAELTKKHGILFHTDAVQFIGKKEITLRDTSIDLLKFIRTQILRPKGHWCSLYKKWN